jgi:hypothetical protein
MTMPNERTRSLRFGLEFLKELRASPGLDKALLCQVDAILQHYPSANEIKAWAAMDAAQSAKDTRIDQHLAPEDPQPDAQIDDDGSARTAASPLERTRALKLAWCLFMDLRFEADLPEFLKQQIPYVLRHFLDARGIDHWAKMDAWESAQDAPFTAWLAPETDVLSEFSQRRGKPGMTPP